MITSPEFSLWYGSCVLPAQRKAIGALGARVLPFSTLFKASLISISFVLLQRAISKKKYVLSVRHGDRAVIHFLIERAGETDHVRASVPGLLLVSMVPQKL